MVASMACFVANDATVKTFSDEMNLFHMLALRGWMGALLCLAIAWWIDGTRSVFEILEYLAVPSVALRIVFEITSTIFFLLALFSLPLANAIALLQTLPLLLMIAGVFVFKEHVGPYRWAAAFVGFLGVLLIIQPGTEGFSLASLYALGAAVAMTGRDLFTKAVPPRVPSTYVNFLTTLAVWLLALAMSPFMGPLPATDPTTWVRLVAAATFIAFGFLFSIQTMRVGDVSFVAPFRYTIMLWALVLGILVFDEWPDRWQLIGALLVVGAGLFTFYRERLSARKAAIVPETAPVSSASH